MLICDSCGKGEKVFRTRIRINDNDDLMVQPIYYDACCKCIDLLITHIKEFFQKVEERKSNEVKS